MTVLSGGVFGSAADDLTDPAPANTFAHLDSTIILERKIAEFVAMLERSETVHG